MSCCWCSLIRRILEFRLQCLQYKQDLGFISWFHRSNLFLFNKLYLFKIKFCLNSFCTHATFIDLYQGLNLFCYLHSLPKPHYFFMGVFRMAGSTGQELNSLFRIYLVWAINSVVRGAAMVEGCEGNTVWNWCGWWLRMQVVVCFWVYGCRELIYSFVNFFLVFLIYK
ncbi:hypothetical protein RchiOBHm_Chr4g0426631 [Rosa chinensis]|uniref:Uncharacterized protein n=1 Tax=Rosa chinensis TaxID=74649 RepID=A0A2P6QZI7_ROSCH|nr:hypothetical protein RchiOBHm_Chr4g0426631 [Rosa chinensis]